MRRLIDELDEKKALVPRLQIFEDCPCVQCGAIGGCTDASGSCPAAPAGVTCLFACSPLIVYETQCTCKDCEELATWLELAATFAGEHYNLRFPIAAEPKIRQTWADVH